MNKPIIIKCLCGETVKWFSGDIDLKNTLMKNHIDFEVITPDYYEIFIDVDDFEEILTKDI